MRRPRSAQIAPVAQLGDPEKENGPEWTFFPVSAAPGMAWPVTNIGKV
jgi:hypothetical protein